jgi:PAS domain S-box-containing protein
MHTKVHNNIPKFLQNGGEMAQIIADKDWSSHALGNPENWPLSLKITLGCLLKNAFPAFLLWGKDLVNFYNDAYRPSLGKDGKHPFIIGQKFDDAWPELQDSLKLVAEKVMQTGEAFWFENQLIPIYRNGKMEDVYWTFSYSAVFDDSLEINGVLITVIETTNEVHNLRKLKDNEDDLQFAINATDLGTWDYNPLNDTLRTNNRVKNWFGLSVDEDIELAQATNAIISSDRERVGTAIENVLKGENEGKYDIIYTIQNKQNGQERIVRALGRSWFNAENVAYRFNGTLQDITDQQKNIENLKSSEEWFRRLVKEIPVGISIVSVSNYVINVVNDTALFIWQKTLEETHNKPLFEVLTEIEVAIVPIFEEIIRTKKSSKGMEYPFVLERNGVKETGYFNFIFKPVLDENNEVTEIMLVAFEVTETVKARFILEQSEKQFKNIVMQSPISMGILKGENLTVEMANKALLELFWHKTEEETLGKGLVELFPNLSDSKYPDVMKKVLATGNSESEKESFAILEDEKGSWEFYVDYDYLPIKDIDGKVTSVMVTTTDVTDRVIARKKLEQFSKELELEVNLRTKQLKVANNQLELSIKALENRNEELEAFAYVSSHDLQEPLRKIQIFISRILDKEYPVLSDKGKDHFNIIIDSATRMRILIDDLLAFSKINKKDSAFENVDLNSILNEVLIQFSDEISNQKIDISSEKLPIIQAIPFQMLQVFTNILSNAIKFSSKSEQPKIIVQYEIASDSEIKKLQLRKNIKFHKITITDNGIGIIKGMESKIFEVFQRAHSKKEYEGTGIGLAIVKKIITNHEGIIYAKSSKEKGTSFIILVPEAVFLH